MLKHLLFIFLFSYSVSSYAKGFLDHNYYVDSRNFNTYTLNVSYDLNESLNYFSLTNYSNSINAQDRLDKQTFYSEQFLNWMPFKISFIGFTGQWTLVSGDENDMLRFGPKLVLSQFPGLKRLFEKINMWYFVNLYVVQVDDRSGYNWQIEHVYRINLLSDRLYLGGFIDHSLGKDKISEGIVMEHQLGIRLVDQLHFVTEYRYNHFLEEKEGLGIGLQYLMLF